MSESRTRRRKRRSAWIGEQVAAIENGPADLSPIYDHLGNRAGTVARSFARLVRPRKLTVLLNSDMPAGVDMRTAWAYLVTVRPDRHGSRSSCWVRLAWVRLPGTGSDRAMQCQWVEIDPAETAAVRWSV